MIALAAAFVRRTSTPPNPWVIGGFFVFFIAVFILVIMAEKMRKQRLIEAAGALGFFPEQPESLPRNPADLFEQDAPQVEFAMAGTSAGLECHLFDFAHGKAKQRRRQTIALYRSGGVSLPQFRLAPMNFATKMFARMMPLAQGHAISEQVGERFYLWSKDPDVKRVLTPEVLQYLEQLPPSELWADGKDDALFIYFPGRTINAGELSTFLDNSGNLANGLFSQVRSATF